VISSADDPDNPVQVALEQTRPALWRPPSGRWSTIDRAGRIGILSYNGQNPYELSLGVRLDGYPRTGSRTVSACSRASRRSRTTVTSRPS
jgi:hypothetical protein